jgi:hypothetical protein
MVLYLIQIIEPIESMHQGKALGDVKEEKISNNYEIILKN